MRPVATSPLARLRVGLERLRQSIGWAGITGLAFLVAAAVVLALAWSAQRAFVRSNALRIGEVIARPSAPASLALTNNDRLPSDPVSLPPASDIPLLLTQMKQAAVSSGLAWRAAEYRINEATSTRPASVEVHCSINGTYPDLRNMLVQLKDEIPALTIREFSASRPNAETASVEAKLALAVFLQDGALASDAPMPTKVSGPPR